MKPLILILLLCTCGLVQAQPVIDSMAVDEFQGRLQIQGHFLSQPESVSVDGIEMPIIVWSDSLIIVSLPDSGKGSAGQVIVKNKDASFDSRMLTLIQSSSLNYYLYKEVHGTENTDSDNFRVRMDLHSLLKNKKKGEKQFTPSHLSYIFKNHHSSAAFDVRYGTNVTDQIYGKLFLEDTLSQFSSGFNAIAEFNVSEHSLRFHISKVKGATEELNFTSHSNIHIDSIFPYVIGDYISGCTFDSAFNIVQYNVVENSPTVHTERGVSGSVSFLPPSKLIAIQNKPSIQFPSYGAILPLTSLSLVWSSMSDIDSFRIQVSESSNFNSTVIDTTIADTLLLKPSLLDLRHYYWRVSGKNSEGVTDWSEIEEFILAVTTSVSSTSDMNEKVSIYPNPATSSEIKINYVTNALKPLELLLTDLSGKTVISQINYPNISGTHSLSLPGISSGDYILLCKSDKFTTSQILKIQR